jgi:hypothetical protein
MQSLFNVSNFEQKLVGMSEHFDDFLQFHVAENPNVYRDRILREAYPAFQGLSQKTNIWHPGLGPQAGISDWRAIQVSTLGSGADGGFNACAINPQTYTFSVESKEYTGLTTEWRSPTICVKDTMWTEMANEQVAAIYGMGVFITASAWEVYAREMYMQFAKEADNLFVLTEGDVLENNPKFDYDPFTEYTRTTSFGATEKFTVLKLDPGVSVSTLNFSFLDLFHNYLAAECPGAAVANEGGLPVFALMVHLTDVEKALRSDPDLRQDMRDAVPQMLFQNYMQTFRVLRGWGYMHDAQQARFKYWKIGDDGKLWFRRVLPKREGRALTIGRLPEANPEYQTAELAVAVPFFKEVYKIRIPPKVDSLGGQAVFGPAPGFNGDWQWVNYPSHENPLREIGYHYMRLAAFPAPLKYSNRAMAFVYRRCPQTWPTACSTGSQTPVDGCIAIAVDVDAESDLDATNRTLTVRLASRLAAAIGDAVLVKQTGASVTEVNGTLVGDAGAPVYVIAFTATEYAKLESAYLTIAAGKVCTAGTVEDS